MAKAWKDIAKRQFESMPKDYREDWRDLRERIMK